jgi:peptide/nickel transport system substrate-binding protein
MDPSRPNLLEEDSFYATILPQMLGQNFQPHGLLKQASIGRPANLHPFSEWQNVSSWHDQCSVAVATMQFGKYETFAPDMAVKVELRHRPSDGAVEYWVFLRDDAFWQPLTPEMFSPPIQMDSHFLRRHPVTAHDFKFYYDAIMNPYVQLAGAVALRTYLTDLEEIEVLDDHAFVARWKTKAITENGKPAHKAKYISKQMTGGLRPLASFVYQYFPNGKKIIEDDTDPHTYRTNSVWAQNFAQHWAQNVIPSCGPWTFESMSEREIHFKRNDEFYHPLAVLVDGAITQFKETPDAIWQGFKAGGLDIYTLQPDQTIELENYLSSEQYQQQAGKGSAIKRLNYIARTYTYVGWNQAKPFFKNRKVRQALTMAIDRERIIRQYLNGLGIPTNGPFYPYSPNYDKAISPWPFDLEASRRLLQQDGWFDSDNDGIIDKVIDGVLTPFRFRLTYYVKNPTAKTIAEYISTSLKQLGILCELDGVDIADLSGVFDDKGFDAMMLGWALGSPPEELRQLWSSAGAKEKGSSNAIGFSNAEVDEIIDKLDYEFDPEERIKLYHRFARIIHHECPYTFLYTPKTALLYRGYMQNVWIPAERQDLIPGANVAEPNPGIFWIKERA